MSSILLKNAIVVTPDGSDGVRPVLIADGVIVSVGEATASADREIDLSGSKLFPGFIDIHNHGAVGVDVNNADAEALLEVGKFLAKNGVTAWLPTLVTDSNHSFRRAIDAIDLLMEIQTGQLAAQAVGVHYEGVFANENMCGALRPEFFKKFTGKEASDLPRLRTGIHMTTVAPEIDGGIELIQELVGQGWIVAIGHTRGDPEVLDRAFSAGARHLTHLFNAMTGIHHRDRGVAGWGLTTPDVTFDIIADGFHVHPSMLEFACRAKGVDKVSLISDSIAPTGLGDGQFELWGETITVENGRTQNERGSIAGSVITMCNAVRQMVDLGFSTHEIAQMSSANPSRLLQLNQNRGAIAVGKRADVVGIDDAGNVNFTMIGGMVIEN